MSAWVWVVAVAAVLFVAWFAWARRWLASVRYSWRRSRHVAAAAPEPEYRFVDQYGSMVLAEERDCWRGEGPYWLTAPSLVAGPDWREQTAADLSPEALEDPGLGGLSSLTPGPDPGSRLAAGVVDPGLNPAQHAGHASGEDRQGAQDEAGSRTDHLHAPTRLADTADVMDARLLAEVEAMLRAQDDDTALYLSRLRSACAQARLDLAAALA